MSDSQDESSSISDHSLSSFVDGLEDGDVDDEADEEQSTSKGDGVFEVEKILDSRYNYKEKTHEYLIKWVGFPDKDNSWTPTKNLNCPERIKEFYDNQQKKQRAPSMKHTLKTFRHKSNKLKPNHFVRDEVKPKRRNVGCSSDSDRKIVRKAKPPKKAVVSDDDDSSSSTMSDQPKSLKAGHVAVIDSDSSDIDSAEPSTSSGVKATTTQSAKSERRGADKGVKSKEDNVTRNKENLPATKVLCKILEDENDNGFQRGWTVERIMAMKKKSGNNEAGISHAVVKFKGLKIPQLVPIKIVMENARKTINMVISTEDDQPLESWFVDFLTDCFQRNINGRGFFDLLSGRLRKHASAQLANICDLILQNSKGASIKQGLAYINILLRTKNINEVDCVNTLIQFDDLFNVEGVEMVVENLYKCTSTMKYTCNSEEQPLLLYQVACLSLKWMVNALQKSILLDMQSMIPTLNALLDGIIRLRDDVFTHILIFLYLECVPDDRLKLAQDLESAFKMLSERIEDKEAINTEPPKRCYDKMRDIVENFQLFSEPPQLEWRPYREDFIYRELRPAILTLGSIFATFRVLMSTKEIAESFLFVGDTLGMSRSQIVFDILRSGFLVQIETHTGKEELRDREALADLFVFLKMPSILLNLTQLGVEREDILNALTKISNSATLLNEVDRKKNHNTFQYIVQELKQLNLLNEDEECQLCVNRKQGLEQKPELIELLRKNNDERSQQRQSRVQLFVLAQKAKKVCEKMVYPQDPKKFSSIVTMVQSLLRSGEFNFDAVCSVCCADGDLSTFSTKLAWINCKTQKPSADPDVTANRVVLFDYTFLLLSRIVMVWEDLRLEEVVGENVDCPFNSWIKKYSACIESGQPMPIDSHLKMNFLNQIVSLKNSQLFWNESWDFDVLIDHAPLIGDIILDEYKKENYNEKEIYNILSTFHQMPCLLLCLIQWLETQPISNARQAFAKTIQNFTSLRGQDSSDRWMFTSLIARKSLKQMAEDRRQKEQPYTWGINLAQRRLPALSQHQNEPLDLQALKETFLYSNQQSWASPDAIAHINRCNRLPKQGVWCQCWMMQMLKMWTSDEMEMASELCISAALTHPVPCLLAIIQQLVDYVLFDFMSKTSSHDSSISSNSSSFYQHNYVNIAIHKTSATVLAKMLVRTLILLLWAEDQRKRAKQARGKTYKKINEGSSAASQNQRSDAEMPVDDNSGGVTKTETTDEDVSMENAEGKMNSELQSSTNPAACDPVLETISRVFERFDSMIKGSCLRPTVTFIIFFVHELAKAPRTTYRQKLIDFIPINLIFSLARLDSAALPLSLFFKLYDIKRENNRLNCLKYACMMRKLELI